MTETTFLPSARVLALIAALSFAPVAVTFAVAPGVWWADYPGIFFHLATFLLVPWLPVPDWAKAAGYAWLALDTTVGVMTLNGIDLEFATPIRLGGHIFAGIWIVAASMSGSRPVKVVGATTGLWLAAYTFVSPFLPMSVIGPTAIMMLIWLVIIALQNGSTRQL